MSKDRFLSSLRALFPNVSNIPTRKGISNMSKASYQIVKKEDRVFFNDGNQYVLFDSGFIGNPFGKNSASVSGKIGPFEVNTQSRNFFETFINLKMDDGRGVTAVLNPMDGYNCVLRGNTLLVSEEEIDVADCDYAFPFADPHLPIVDGCINGRKVRLFFDSGARMTMFGDRSLASEKIGSYKEWMAMKHTFAELDVCKLSLDFPNGLHYEGKGALVDDPLYIAHGKMMGIDAMLGIDLFEHYDLTVISKGTQRGIYLSKR